MRFETQQADPGSNLQGFSMFLDLADGADKRRVSRCCVQSPVTYDVPEETDRSRNPRQENEETPRGEPRRW